VESCVCRVHSTWKKRIAAGAIILRGREVREGRAVFVSGRSDSLLEVPIALSTARVSLNSSTFEGALDQGFDNLRALLTDG
jgi:hypothetical protein